MSNSLNLIFEQVKGRVSDQLETIDGLDAKAGILLGFIGTVASVLLFNVEKLKEMPWQVVLLFFICLLISATSAAISVQVRNYFTVPDPKTLIEEYSSESEDETKADLTGTYSDAFYKNETILENKIRWLNRAIVFLLLSVVIITALQLNFLYGVKIFVRE